MVTGRRVGVDTANKKAPRNFSKAIYFENRCFRKTFQEFFDNCGVEKIPGAEKELRRACFVDVLKRQDQMNWN